VGILVACREVFLGAIAVLGFVLFIWVETRPSVETVEAERYMDYSTGVEACLSRHKLCLGRFPLLNRLLWRTKRITTIDFFQAPTALTLGSPSRRTMMKIDTDWTTRTVQSGIEILVKRTKMLGSSDVHELVLETLREHSRALIDEKIETRFEEKTQNGKIMLIASVYNRWDVSVRNYELRYLMKTLEGLTALRVRSSNGKDHSLNPLDCSVRFEVPFPYLIDMKARAIGERKSFLLVATVDIDPGLTTIEFEYTSLR